MYNTDFNIQEWKAKKQEERQTAFAVQEEAMQAVFESGQTLTDYFYGRGRLGSHITAGNAAVILETNPLANVALPANFKNILAVCRSRNIKNRTEESLPSTVPPSRYLPSR